MTMPGDLTPTERDALDAVLALAPEPAARIGVLVDFHGHLSAAELVNIRRALDALPDAPEPGNPR